MVRALAGDSTMMIFFAMIFSFSSSYFK